MHFPTVFSTLVLLASSALAGPVASRNSACLDESVAAEIVSQFGSLLSNYSNSTANNLLASDFVDTSDSINYLAGIPLGGATFPSKQAFELGQGSQPPVGFQVLSIDAVTCNGVIAFRWVAQVGQQTYPAQGIDILYASLKGYNHEKVGPHGWQLDKVYSEFNSAAWVVDIGGTCPPPSGQA